MQRRRREHHHHRSSESRSRKSLTSLIRKPGTQIAFLLVVGLIIFLILQMGGNKAAVSDLPRTISVSDAYNLYQNGAFVLDVRTQEEWNEVRIPNTTLIPLDQLPSRLNEVPHDKRIVVVCRSGNRSQQGRDILLDAGFKQVTSMSGGVNEWRANGYTVEP
ncbi:MAG: rhodanese-like domain-containing protein [Chloroflexota bacterium]|nr:rhodanese-like domain-containing protein [Anaerolineales bacterium]